MNRTLLCLFGLFAFLINPLRAHGQLQSQSDLPPPPYATVTYADGSSVVAPGAGGTFPLVGLALNGAVQVSVQYPQDSRASLNPSPAGNVIVVQALDSGAIIPAAGASSFPDLCDQPACQAVAVLLDTQLKLTFGFVPGVIPGSYRVALRHGARTMLLEFWAADPSNPQIN